MQTLLQPRTQALFSMLLTSEQYNADVVKSESGIVYVTVTVA